MEPAETTNDDKQLNELNLASSIAEKNESLSEVNFTASLSLLVTGGVALVMWPSLGGNNEYFASLAGVVIATGGWLVGSIFSMIENDRVTGKAMRRPR